MNKIRIDQLPKEIKDHYVGRYQEIGRVTTAEVEGGKQYTVNMRQGSPDVWNPENETWVKV